MRPVYCLYHVTTVEVFCVFCDSSGTSDMFSQMLEVSFLLRNKANR